MESNGQHNSRLSGVHPFSARARFAGDAAAFSASLPRDTVHALVESTLRHFITRETPVYLDGLGILFGRETSAERSYLWGDRLVVRKERVRSIAFEKCYDLTQYHRDRFPGILTLKELSVRLHAALPLRVAVRAGERDVREHLFGMADELRREITTLGFSNRLPSCGVFYALHNRQGQTSEDWFAGADIFLKSGYEQPLAAGPCGIYDRPVLHSAWELFEAAYGSPVSVITVDLCNELQQLGYDVTAFPADAARSFRVAVFQSPSADGKQQVLLYCTDGLRKLGLDASFGYGTELTFHLPIKTALDTATTTRNAQGIPVWPARPMTMGWILMMGQRSRTLRPGARLSENLSLVPGFDTDLRSIIITPFARGREEQLSTDGPFFYMNIAGICDDEFALAENFGAQHLLALLEHRGLGQYTKPTRSSILSRSNFAPQQRRAPADYVLRDPRLEPSLEQPSAAA